MNVSFWQEWLMAVKKVVLNKRVNCFVWCSEKVDLNCMQKWLTFADSSVCWQTKLAESLTHYWACQYTRWNVLFPVFPISDPGAEFADLQTVPWIIAPSRASWGHFPYCYSAREHFPLSATLSFAANIRYLDALNVGQAYISGLRHRFRSSDELWLG